jgi:hypothetical protein
MWIAPNSQSEKGVKAMNLKDEILAGESYSLEFKLVPNEDRIKYLKTVVAFANGRGRAYPFRRGERQDCAWHRARSGVCGDGRHRQFHHERLLAACAN